jgi:hypothetical protein
MQKCSHVVKPMSILPKEKSRSNPAYFIWSMVFIW